MWRKKLLLEFRGTDNFEKKPTVLGFVKDDIIDWDEEIIWIKRNTLLKSKKELCEIWNKKGHMWAIVEGVQYRDPAFALLRWEDGTKDWIEFDSLEYFNKIGKIKR